MAYVQLVVSDEQKARWSEYVDEQPAVDSISDLIRTAVEGHMARDDDSDPSDLNTQVIGGELDEIESRLATIEDKVDLLRLENVEEDELEGIVENIVERYEVANSEHILKELGVDTEDEWPYK
ncbi:hypothetical protein [Natrononativus amylolyticus]|uniref:hypothetical protein n=1 Tax=Natrononativus amylolyticus TaxID=2963434 RepID=UPI0020CFB88E|nr:hypothetical protein [Natrononativus amylolyticus]